MKHYRHVLVTALTLVMMVYPFVPLIRINVQTELAAATARTLPTAWQETDPALPAAFIELNNGDEFTKDGLVNVSVGMRPKQPGESKLVTARYLTCGSASDCKSKYSVESNFTSWQGISVAGSNDKEGVSFVTGQLLVTDPQGSGVRGICVQVKDDAGRLSPWYENACDTIILDNVAPTGSALIADGAVETHSLDLWGTISATDAVLADGTAGVGNVEYSVSGDNIPWQSWQQLTGESKVLFGTYPVAVTVPTVIRGYVKFRDKLGNESPVYSDDILYTPTSNQALPDQDDSAFWINNRETFTSVRAVKLHFSPAKPVSAIKIWNKGQNSDQVAKQNYQPEVQWELTSGYEQKVVYTQFFFDDGTSSAGIPATIVYAPVYGIEYAPAATGYSEFTLGNFPNALTVERPINFVLSVKNIGSLTWEDSGTSAKTGKPTVHLSYHWYREWHDGTRTLYEFQGNRGQLNTSLGYLDVDSNVRIQINAPAEPGNYIIQFDAVRENSEMAQYAQRQTLVGKVGDWFSNYGNPMPEYQVQIVPVQSVSSLAAESSLTTDSPLVQGRMTTTTGASEQSMITSQVQATGVYYVVQSPRTADPSWRCGGYDCYSGIAEEFYQCKANGIDNSVPAIATRFELQSKCWWPIFVANELKYASQVPLEYKSKPWDYLQVGWVLYIPAISRPGGGVITPSDPKLPTPPTGFQGADSTITPENPYGGFNGKSPNNWPQVTFDRYIAWDGSYKTDQLKWSETRRPAGPIVTAMQTNDQGTAVTVYGVALPKGHPVSVRVWNEYRYCWGCGSGWEFAYLPAGQAGQPGTAQHVKVVLFTRNWEYLGEVWNDNPEGKWRIDLSLGDKLKPGDQVFAEVQIEADYTFKGLHWWSDTYETVNFNLRDRKYTGYPYFGSGRGQGMSVPVKKITDLAEWAFTYREQLATGFGVRKDIYPNACSIPAKDYAHLTTPGDSWKTFTTLVYNSTKNWAFRMRGNILLRYLRDNSCASLGRPTMDDAWAATSPQGTTGAYQQFEQGTIYSSQYGTYATVGVVDQEHNNRGGTAGYGFPTGDMVDQHGKLTQTFEGGTITMCDRGNLAKQQLCVYAKQSRFEYGQVPVLHIVYGNAQKITIEFSTSPNPNTANRFEYKLIDYWPVAADGGEKEYIVPQTLLWSNSRDGQVQKIYYKVTTKRGDNGSIAYFPNNNSFGEEAAFEKVINTPEHINPLESDPFYTYKGGLDYYGGHTGADIKATEGANIRNVRKGTVEQAGVFFHDGCYQVPERNNMDNSVVGVKTAEGEVIRYRHMSISSIDRLIRNGVIKDVDIGQNADVGDVDDVGCSTPGFDHLHVEIQINGVYKEPNQYILF